MRAGGLEAATAVGKVAGTRRRGRQRSRWLDWVTLEVGKQLGELREVWRGPAMHGGVWLGMN